MNSIDRQNSLVVDVTYRCNATCGYCQWGDSKNPSRHDQPDESVLLPRETLHNLGTERVVFSGGEPLLRGDLERIIRHYRSMRLPSIITITNGLLLNPERLKSLIEVGLTGVAFSIDSMDLGILQKTRNYTTSMAQKIFRNLKNALDFNELEIGINCVISAGNLQSYSMLELVQFCNENQLDYLKFNIIFDDGYAGSNAPELILHSSHADLVREIGTAVSSKCTIDTNPIGFWLNVADSLNGKRIVGATCDLGGRQALAIRGEVKFCAWLDNPKYGDATTIIGEKAVESAVKEYENAKKLCKTGPWCFCLQKLNHVWEVT